MANKPAPVDASPPRLPPLSHGLPPGARIPLYRMVNRTARNTNHIYTANAEECEQLFAKKWRCQRIVGYVLQKGDPGGQPLYRLRNKSDTDHIYTTDKARFVTFARKGYKVEMVACHVPPFGSPGVAPLYGLWHPGLAAHIYTRNLGERRKKLKWEGFKDEGLVCQVFVTPEPIGAGAGVIGGVGRIDAGNITDPGTWDQIMRLLKRSDDQVRVAPLTTLIKPIRVINLVQLDTTVTAKKTPSPPGTQELSTEEPSDPSLNYPAGTFCISDVEPQRVGS